MAYSGFRLWPFCTIEFLHSHYITLTFIHHYIPFLPTKITKRGMLHIHVCQIAFPCSNKCKSLLEVHKGVKASETLINSLHSFQPLINIRQSLISWVYKLCILSFISSCKYILNLTHLSHYFTYWTHTLEKIMIYFISS